MAEPSNSHGIEDRRIAQELAEQLVAAAKAAGAQSCDATAGSGSSLSAKARDGAVEHVSRSSSRGAGVRVIVDGRLGFATSAAPPSGPDEIKALAEQAVGLAKVATPSEHNVIPKVTSITGVELARHVERLALYDDEVATAPASWATERAVDMERVLRETEGIATVREVGASTRRSVFALASSSGFAGSYGGTNATLYATGVVDDDGGKKQVDGWWSTGRRFGQLEPPEAVAKEAARRALARRGARKVESGRFPVIFDHAMARTFFGALLSAMNGDRVSRDASFLVDKRGEVLFPKGITLVEDPALVSGFGSRPFDGEGQAVVQRQLIDDEGRLTTWLHDARSAHRMGEQPTGHASRSSTGLPGSAPSNVLVQGGSGDFDGILSETKRGLFVTHLLGHSPDMITGEYSRGASGYWVEDGELVHPVEEITVAGDMVEMLRGIDRVGSDLDHRSSIVVPTIRFADLMISGS